MAVSISNKYNNNAASGSPLTISSVVIASGEQLIVTVMGADGTNSGTTGEVTGVTWNGVSLTKKVEDLNDLGDDGVAVSIWQLASPTPATASVVVTYNGTPSHGVLAEAYVIAGGSTTLGTPAHNGALTAANPTTNSITTVADNSLVIDIFAASSGSETVGTPGGSQTQDFDVGTGLANFSPTAGSHYTKTPAGSASFSWVPSNTARGYTWAAVSIAPSSTTTTKIQPGKASITNTATKTQSAKGNIIQDKVPQYDHVVIVILENQNYTDIIGNTTDAPYINNTLLPTASLLSNYFALDHPSEPNYLALISGSEQGEGGDSDPNIGPPDNLALKTGTNLVDRMEAASVAWKAYMEAMPVDWYTKSGRTMGDTGGADFSGNQQYQEHHNPFVYFQNNNDLRTNTRLTKIVPYTQLATDLAVSGGTGLPKFSWITPEIDHDMHDPINGTTNAIRSGDNWLSTAIPAILTSDAFTKQKGLLLLVWDEDNGLANKVACIAAGYNVKQSFTSSNKYDHYSLLRTVETALGHLTPMQTDGTKNSDLTAAIFSDIFLTSHDQTAVARISKSATKTQTAISRISLLATKTLSALSRITALATKTQSAVANIKNTTKRTISALSRIQITSTGFVGHALQFDGSQNYVDVGTMGSFGSNLSSGAYVSFDFSRLTTTSTATMAFGVLNTGTKTGFFVELQGNNSDVYTSNDIRFFVRDEAGNSISAHISSPSIAIHDGQKHSVVITQSGTTVTITLDGIPQTVAYYVQQSIGTTANFGFPMWIGGRNSRGVLTEPTSATLDNVKMGTSSSVLYGSCSFDEGTGTTTADASGNSNTGTLTGSPTPTWVNGLTPLTGLARISVAATKTLTALSRITALTTQTIAAKARITALTTKIQSALARIQVNSVKTITAVSRISVQTARTISALSRITANANKTVLGLARITALTTKTQTGIARITAQATKTVSALSRITVKTTKTLTGIARITATATKAQTALARITALATKTISAVARIQTTATKTLSAVARISSGNTAKTVTALARITATTVQTIAGKARITAKTLQTITGKSRITIQTVKTLTALARITALAAKTITSVARITATSVKTQLGKARIQISSLKTISALARITKVVSKTQTGISRMTANATKIIGGEARITATATKLQQAMARIQVFTVRNINALARITDIQLRTITGKANLLIMTSRIQLGRARMLSITQRNQTGVARIKSAHGLYRRKSSSSHWLGRLFNRTSELYIED